MARLALVVQLKLFETLLFLVQNAGHLVEKETLMRFVWKGTFVEEGSLAHSVSVLRKILRDGMEGNRYIETVPRHGYRFVAPVELYNRTVPNQVNSGPQATFNCGGSVYQQTLQGFGLRLQVGILRSDVITTSGSRRPSEKKGCVAPGKMAAVSQLLQRISMRTGIDFTVLTPS